MAALAPSRLDHVEFPYLFADVTYVKGRVGGQVVSRAVVVVTGVTTNGEREVLGCAVGDTETEDFWSEFFRSLRARGLNGVALIDHSTAVRIHRIRRQTKASAPMYGSGGARSLPVCTGPTGHTRTKERTCRLRFVPIALSGV